MAVLTRTVLWYMAFFGFAINYMVRINLNITIVEMVLPKTTVPPVAILEDNQTKTQSIARQLSLPLNETFNRTERSLHEVRLNWNEQQQNLILGAFFWLHWVTQIPGGLLAKKFGTKLVFGGSNVIACWLCFLIPYASYWDYRALLTLRTLQGCIVGLAWPAMHNLAGCWIPPNERSNFVTAYLGSSVGIALFYPLFGYIMHWLTWEWVYYVSGLAGTVWWILWLFLVYDSPEEHPRITEAERHYILKSLHGSVHYTKTTMKTPWCAILTSRSVWMNVIAQFGGVWSLFTLVTQAPTYFRIIHGADISTIGLLSGLPHIMRMVFAYCFSIFADYLLRNEKMSVTNVRKLATFVCCIVNGVSVLFLAYYSYNMTAAVVLATMSTMLQGAVSSGPLASVVDITPNFAGIALGVSGMVAVLPGFISPYIVGRLTYKNQTYEAWFYVFLISACILIICGTIYMFFGDSKLQSWNSDEAETETEKEKLKTTNKK